MQVVEENNDLLLKLISDILDLSKIEAGTFEFNYGMLDVNRMCEEAVRSLRLKVQDKPVELLFGDHEEQCRIVGDKNRLLQVITNFINNAVKFTEQGSITLGYRREAGDLLFYVEDTGKASPKSICALFSTVSSNSTALRRAPGWGFRSRRASSSRWAGISASSRRKAGAPVSGSPYLPWHAMPGRTMNRPLWLRLRIRFPSGRETPLLLVAEDTDSNFLLVSLMFRKEFDIVRAVNGEEAVRICREMKPAAILMDIKMPVMDGLEATRRIRAFDPVVPIVAVTAFAYDRDRQKALAAGANEYVAKPLSGEHIRRVLGTLLAGG